MFFFSMTLKPPLSPPRGVTPLPLDMTDRDTDPDPPHKSPLPTHACHYSKVTPLPHDPTDDLEAHPLPSRG